MIDVEVHPRIRERHPDVSEEDVRVAWRNSIAIVRRDGEEKDFFVAIGQDGRRRMLEMVAALELDGTMLVFHAQTPPTKKTLKELGLSRRQRWT